jgi:uncharacterized protein YecE (DUF72 family)
MPETRIGISGWRYREWRGSYYPADLPQKRELEYAANHFDSIEINGTFYSLQRPEYFRSWYARTPADHLFAVKGGRFITHMKRLRNVETALANFFASGVLALEDKLGPFLWQFPANLGFDERFEAFFRRLPRDSFEAAALARHHDRRVPGSRGLYEPTRRRALRHAVEVRSPSFVCREFVDLLRSQGIALVVADTAKRFPYFEDVTADFVYVRLHGDVELYKSGYTPAAIRRWAERVRAWRAGREPRDAVRASPRRAPRTRGRDVYVYFDNDVKAHAPFDALALARELGVERGMRRRA